jgi:hypothetical protein
MLSNILQIIEGHWVLTSATSHTRQRCTIMLLDVGHDGVKKEIIYLLAHIYQLPL